MSLHASALASSFAALLLSAATNSLAAETAVALVDRDPGAAARATASGPVAEEVVKRLKGGAVVRLAPGTRIEMGKAIKLKLGPEGAAETVTQTIRLVSGRLDVSIPKSKVPQTALLIQTPHKVSAVAKGGHSIAVLDGKRATFAAVDYEMLSASGNDWRTLKAGLVRSFVGAASTLEEHAVPGVPTLSVSRPIVLALDGRPSSTEVRAAGITQAEHYEVSVWRVRQQGPELVRRIDVKQPSGRVDGLTPGRYQVTARAIDASGISGDDSSPQALRVVGAELPTEGRYENGVVLLGQHARLKLVGVEGLEASYGQATHFVPAPSSVGLSHGEGTVLRLRVPGSSDEVMSPKTARWPLDNVDVTVRLTDNHGRPVSETVKVTTKVLIDVTDVDVKWQRKGNLLTTRVPTQSGTGPWVIRVEVTDEFGDPAGRDFLEVAGPPDTLVKQSLR
jgi:hypothetical protein